MWYFIVGCFLVAACTGENLHANIADTTRTKRQNHAGAKQQQEASVEPISYRPYNEAPAGIKKLVQLQRTPEPLVHLQVPLEQLRLPSASTANAHRAPAPEQPIYKQTPLVQPNQYSPKMAEIIVCCGDIRIPIALNDNGNLLVHSLKTHFPSANRLTYNDDEDKVHNLALDSDEVILQPAVKEYYVHQSNASHAAEKLASTCSEENCNKENELNGTCDSNERCSEDIKSNNTRQAVSKNPVRVLKTLRIGWMNKTAGQTKYRKVHKPRGGVKKLKLDEAMYYSVHQIRRMSIEAFENTSNKENCAIEDEYTVNLGDFGGQIISDFNRQDGKLCDIWEYCRDRGKSLYQLNLYMLTSPIDEEVGVKFNVRTISTRRRKAQPKIINNVRVFYMYLRRSSYSNELSYIEYEKSGLHSRMLDDNCGEGPPIEYFHPLDHGYTISRIELIDQVLLQIYFEDDENRSIEFPSESKTSLEEHSIIYDLDRLQGYCDWKFGIGFVPSCTDACRPLFSWYKDGAIFKSMECLYWLDNVKDDQPHLWSCIVTCKKTDRQLKSKEILIDGFE